MSTNGMEASGRVDWRRYLTLAAAVTVALKLLVSVAPAFGATYSYLLALGYAAFVYPVWSAQRESRIPGLRLLLAGLVWAVAASCFHRYTEPEIARLMTYFLLLLLAAFICYPMAHVLGERRNGALALVSAVLIGLVALLSLLGLALALTGGEIALYGSLASYASGRLYVFLYPTAFAVAATLALLLLPGAYASARRKWARVLLLAAAVLLYLAMALTGATITQLLFALCAGGYAFLLAQTRLKTDNRTRRALLSLLLAAAALAVCFGGQYAVKRGFDAVAPEAPKRAQAARVLPAQATLPAREGTVLQKLAMPDVLAPEEEPAAALGFVGTRLALWKGAAKLFSGKPALLITGVSPVRMEDALAVYLPKGLSGANMRALPVQALVAFGVPGLVAVLAFAVYVLVHAARLFFFGGRAYAAAERSLALVPLFCLLADCTDCLLTFTDAGGLSNPVFFLAAGYVVFRSVEGDCRRAAGNGRGGESSRAVR